MVVRGAVNKGLVLTAEGGPRTGEYRLQYMHETMSAHEATWYWKHPRGSMGRISSKIVYHLQRRRLERARLGCWLGTAAAGTPVWVP